MLDETRYAEPAPAASVLGNRRYYRALKALRGCAIQVVALQPRFSIAAQKLPEADSYRRKVQRE